MGPRRPPEGRRGRGRLRARPEAPLTPHCPPRASPLGGAGAAEGRAKAGGSPRAGRERRPPPSPACRAPAARGLTASTACCKIEVNLENILSRDCSSLSRDDLESSSIRRRRPCCGCRGRSRVKAGAERRGRAEGRRRPGPAASGVRGRRGGSGGRCDVAGGEESVARGLRPRDAAAAAAAARTRWQPGSGSFRLLFPPRPAGGAAATRGGRARPALRPRGLTPRGRERRGEAAARGGSRPERSRRPRLASGRLRHSHPYVFKIQPVSHSFVCSGSNMPIL